MMQATSTFPSSRITLAGWRLLAGRAVVRSVSWGIGLIIALVVTSPISHGQPTAPRVHRLYGVTMGSVEWQVSVVAHDSRPLDATEQRIKRVLEELDQRMSTWIPDSEVSRFNDAHSTEWFGVSRDTAEVVARAREISQASEGAFDVTVKPLVELWNFGKGRGAFVIPSHETIEAHLNKVGWRKLEVRLEPPALRKSEPGVQIDLSGIAKGYAVDLVGRELDRDRWSDWFVEIGGEVATRGRKPNGMAWRVGIEKPLDDERAIERIVELQDCAMATSGDYRNFAIVDGQRYSHTISPATGAPVTHGLASVSVIAKDCMTADAAATAVMATGPEGIDRLAKAIQVDILALERQGDGFREIKSANFPESVLVEEVTNGRSSSIRRAILAVVLVALAIAGLAVGVVLRGRPIRGSCGGSGSTACELCDRRTSECGAERVPEQHSP